MLRAALSSHFVPNYYQPNLAGFASLLRATLSSNFVPNYCRPILAGFPIYRFTISDVSQLVS
jgi:hypothetical protein